MRYIPSSLLEANINYIISTLETILQRFKSLEITDIERLFKKYTRGKNIENFFGEFHNLPTLLQRHTNNFTIIDNQVYPSRARNLRPGELPVTPDKVYFELSTQSTDMALEDKSKSYVLNETIDLEFNTEEIDIDNTFDDSI